MDEDIGFVKPKDKRYTRRSSFFRRSLSSYNFDSPTGIRATLAAQPGETTRIQDHYKTEYLSKLKKEKEDWKDLFYERTKYEEELSEKFPRVASSVDFLTEKDKKILEDRPAYLAIGRLLDSVTELVAIKQQRINSTMKKVNNFITHCEQISDDQAGDVIDHFMEDFDEFGDAAPAS